MQHRFPGLIPSDLGTLVHNYAEQAAGWAAGKAGSILRNTATFLMDVTFTIFAMFYFYRDGAAIVTRIRDRLPFEEAQRMRVMEDTHSLIFATVFSTLAAAVMHGVDRSVDVCVDRNRVADFLGRADGIFFIYSDDRHGADLGSAGAEPDAGGASGGRDRSGGRVQHGDRNDG